MPKSQAEFVSFCHKQKTFSVEQVARYLRCNPTELIGVLKIHANLHTTDQTQVSSETLSNLKEAILKIKSLGKYQFPTEVIKFSSTLFSDELAPWLAVTILLSATILEVEANH